MEHKSPDWHTVVTYYHNKEKDKVVMHAYGLYSTRSGAHHRKKKIEKGSPDAIVMTCKILITDD